MLAFAVRGVVLLGVLSWYSAIIWRMIDSYFKDQFRVYLQEEYRKYPRMRADVESVEAVDKGFATPSGLPAESSFSRSITESPSDPDAVCPVDIADTCQRTTASNGKPKEAVAGGTSENAVAVGAGSTDKNAFPENAAQPVLESRKLPSSSDAHDEERRPGVIHQDGDREERVVVGRNEIGILASTPRPEKPRRRLGKRGLSGASKGAPRAISRGRPRKRRVNTIVLTDADFVDARADGDDDFSEFEEEGGDEKVFKEGILISELPFKPKADIGDLDRVTAEEFCPLTLEDEATCGETTTWS
jgi:hypothetical protein